METTHMETAKSRQPKQPQTLLACLAVVGLLPEACAPAHTYCVRRAALVPVPAPSLRPARQASGKVEFHVSSETLSFARAPKKLAGSNVGLYVPRHQLSGALVGSPHPMFNLGVSFETGLPEGAIPISKGLIDPPTRAIGGIGAHFGIDVKASSRLTISLSYDLWPYWIQSRIAYYDLGTNGGSCDGLPDPNTWNHKSRSTLTFLTRAQLGLGIDMDWSYLTLGAGIRNQPYNVDATREEHLTSSSIGPEVAQKPYPYIYASWEIRATNWLGISLAVYQPLYFDPIVYAPVIGINLRFSDPGPHRYRTPRPPPPQQRDARPGKIDLIPLHQGTAPPCPAFVSIGHALFTDPVLSICPTNGITV